MERRKIFLDTDIGDDIDDAFALALLAKCPEIELVGISTVFRNVLQRGKIVLSLLKDFNSTGIPVYLGEKGTPDKLNRIFPYEKFDENGLPVVAHYRDEMDCYQPNDGDGVEEILKAIEKYGAELEILAIGPLTNIAAAFKRNPETFKKVGGITVMGGTPSVEAPEWNIRWDPEGARTVFNSGVNIRVIALNTTKQCTFTEEDLAYFRKNLNGKYSSLKKMMEIWIVNIAGRTNPVMHDPLAAATLMGDFCTFEEKYVYVWLEEDRKGRAGYTAFFDYPVPQSGKVRFATAVDSRGFMEFLKKRLFEGE